MRPDDDIREQLREAAGRFPVHRTAPDLSSRVAGRRRATARLTILGVGVAIVGVVAGTALVTRPAGGPNSHTATVSPDFAAAAAADYVGSSWLLTRVIDQAVPTQIPEALGVRVNLLTDGMILADDGGNGLSGHFTRTAGGFEVQRPGTTFALYAGNDPVRRAAIAAISALIFGPDEDTTSRPARIAVVRVNEESLTLRVGAWTLDFTRSGPAATRITRSEGVPATPDFSKKVPAPEKTPTG